MTRQFCLLIVVAVAAGASAAAAATPVVPVFTQHLWWSHDAAGQQAWRCVNGVKLVAGTTLGTDRFADVGLGRIVASGHRIR